MTNEDKVDDIYEQHRNNIKEIYSENNLDDIVNTIRQNQEYHNRIKTIIDKIKNTLYMTINSLLTEEVSSSNTTVTIKENDYEKWTIRDNRIYHFKSSNIVKMRDFLQNEDNISKMLNKIKNQRHRKHLSNVIDRLRDINSNVDLFMAKLEDPKIPGDLYLANFYSSGEYQAFQFDIIKYEKQDAIEKYKGDEDIQFVEKFNLKDPTGKYINREELKRYISHKENLRTIANETNEELEERLERLKIIIEDLIDTYKTYVMSHTLSEEA
jgi:hypothetical protein